MNDNNLKIIQVSDLHFLKDGETMYGANPVNRFRAFINVFLESFTINRDLKCFLNIFTTSFVSFSLIKPVST